MRNKTFHFVWNLIKGFYRVPRKEIIRDAGVNLRLEAPFWIAQIKWARWLGLGRPIRILIGDSDQEVLNKPELMRQFKELTFNWGIGGTTTHDWAQFLSSPEFKHQIEPDLPSDVIFIVHLGGNDILQRKLNGTRESIQKICQILGTRLVWTQVPVVYFDILISANPALRNARAERSQVNLWIEKYTEGRSFDTTPFIDVNRDGVPDPGTMTDPVHYGGYFLELLIDIYSRYNKASGNLFRKISGF